MHITHLNKRSMFVRMEKQFSYDKLQHGQHMFKMFFGVSFLIWNMEQRLLGDIQVSCQQVGCTWFANLLWIRFDHLLLNLFLILIINNS